jgi:hypothetical protein
LATSFDIAVYFERTYPDLALPLIPPQPEAIMRAWNEKCNAMFSGTTNTFGPIGMLYVHRLPFNPKTAEASKSKCVVTVPGVSSWDDFNLEDEARVRNLGSFSDAMQELGRRTVGAAIGCTRKGLWQAKMNGRVSARALTH